MITKTTNSKKIVVGLSGGVDSTIALILLKQQGWEPIGVTLKLPVWENPKNICRENICCTKESSQIAKSVCKKLHIPYFVIDAGKEFKKEVIDYFVKELKKYHTPNPCIVCNHKLKFKLLIATAKKFNAFYVATGHYARVRFNKKTGLFELLRGKDKIKDQSYSLSYLNQQQLAHIILPLGNYHKQEVYQLAKRQGLKYFEKKKESQNFCFVSNQALPLFITKSLGLKTGKIVDTKGKILGYHQGLYFYTIGQRKGLGLKGPTFAKASAGQPYYVKEFNAPKNRLIVTKNKKDLLKKEIRLAHCHFISGQVPQKKILIKARIRYRQKLALATLYPPQNKKMKIIFDKPQLAVTPGQFCVFYQKDVCLGEGVII